MAVKFKACSVECCNGNAHYSESGAKGFCRAHYRRLCRNGDPLSGGIARGEARAWLMRHTAWDGKDCLIWPFYRGPRGYGVINIGRRPHYASHIMCKEAHGTRPTPKHEAAHSCGKGHLGCVNPSHLEWKTVAGNQADKLIHGTHNRGERHKLASLTEGQVKDIIALFGTKTQQEIASLFGVSRGTISNIRCGRNWAWVSRA